MKLGKYLFGLLLVTSIVGIGASKTIESAANIASFTSEFAGNRFWELNNLANDKLERCSQEEKKEEELKEDWLNWNFNNKSSIDFVFSNKKNGWLLIDYKK